jgi:16S rRNA (guanine966-N2)-methyltransferase
MRVIGGSAKGRLLKAVPGDGTRPILDRVKVPLFDILRPSLPGMRLLDLFAGTGSVGIEALSQGAESCVFLDTNAKAVQTIKHNLDLRNSTKSFDLIYVAPPQYKGIWIEAMKHIAERPNLISENGIVIVQIDPKEYEELSLSLLRETEQRKYGSTVLVFYRK